MTNRQARVWEYLDCRARGRRNGVSHAELSAALGIPSRRVRECVNALVLLHGKAIGSHPRSGVYVCLEPQDFHHACQCLADEVFPSLKRRRLLKRWQRELFAPPAPPAPPKSRAEAMASQPSLFDNAPAAPTRAA